MTPAWKSTDIAIVGAGSAGLATAALLQRAGPASRSSSRPGPEPGAAWRERYDRLRLHTPRLLSGLPGLRIPRRYGRWVARDDLIEYLRAYVDAHGLDVRTGTRVTRIDRDGDGWRLETEHGPLRAATVIVATGYNGAPFVPDWPGRERVHRRARPLVRSTETPSRIAAATCSSSAPGTRARRSRTTSPTAARSARGSRCARRRRSCAARPPAFRRS